MFLDSFLVVVLLALCSVIVASPTATSPTQNHNQNQQRASETCIDRGGVQGASKITGQEPGSPGLKAGQSASDTDDANFINFCTRETLTNGSQVTAGSCNPIPMGQIPSTSNMISAMIAFPLSGSTIPFNQTFTVSVRTTHLAAGAFVNPTTNYYSAPQELDEEGDVIGHCHVTIQDIGSLDSTTPPDPNNPVFFKGIDDAGDGKGLLKAVVDGGLKKGAYRVCTMIAARNHQPVMMPVAKRGPQDDCNKFTVV
ncbi:hypothetical protein B0J14DRAFT_599635 [Halenospora varia]|nr:hypothetical protein B0J14DRAFT_599635 [Halenospora varia]